MKISLFHYFTIFIFLFPFLSAAAQDDPQAEEICVLNKTNLPIQIHRTRRDSIDDSSVFQSDLSAQSAVLISRRTFSPSSDTGTMVICLGSHKEKDICTANTNGKAESTIDDTPKQIGNCGEKCEFTQDGVNEYQLTCTAMEVNPWDLPCDGSCNISSNFKKYKNYKK